MPDPRHHIPVDELPVGIRTPQEQELLDQAAELIEQNERLAAENARLRGEVEEKGTVVDRMQGRLNEAHDRISYDVTGLASGEVITDRIDAEFENAKPDLPKIALLLMDLENFKSINDRWGHAVGDELLAEIAATVLTDLKGPADVAARWFKKGDENGVLLLDPQPPEGLSQEEFLEELRTGYEKELTKVMKAFMEDKYRQGERRRIHLGVTVVFGVPEEGDTPESFIERVDKLIEVRKRERAADTTNGYTRREQEATDE